MYWRGGLYSTTSDMTFTEKFMKLPAECGISKNDATSTFLVPKDRSEHELQFGTKNEYSRKVPHPTEVFSTSTVTF